MRKTTMMAERLISLCLAFVIGFFSAFGAIAGGIYFVYSSVSLDKLNQWLGIPLDGIVNPDAEKPVTSLSIADLLAEIQEIQDSELTLQEMIERYGLILPEDVVNKIPASVKNEIPFTLLFSEEGVNYLMGTVTVTDIFDMIPPEFAGTIGSEPMRETLKDHTLADIVAMDMGYIFEGVQLGYITGVTYELDENEIYQVVYKNPDEPDLLELIAPLDLGGILDAVSNGEGNVFEVIERSIGDVTVGALLGTFMNDVALISGLIGDATLEELIVFNSETGEYKLDMMVALEGKKLGALLGYVEVEGIDPETEETVYHWEDVEGNEQVGVMAILSDILVTDFMNGGVDINSMITTLKISDLLGFEKGEKLPVFMHDDLENEITLEKEITIWYQGDKVADKMMSAIADKDFEWVSTSISQLMLSDILGYCQYEGQWYMWEIQSVNDSDAIVLKPGDAVMSEIVGTNIAGLSNVSSEIRDIQIAKLLDYESICDEQGNHLYWSSERDAEGNPVEATGIMASLADLTVAELSGNKLQEKIDAMTIATVMGYTQDKDGNWLKNGQPVDGIMGTLAGSSVGSLSNDIEGMQLGKLLGYTPEYKKDESGNATTEIAYWKDKTGAEASGIMGTFVDLTVSQMSDNATVQEKIDAMTIADIMGYTPDGNGGWKKGDEKIKGIMAAIADTNVGGLSSRMDTLTMKDVLGLKQDEKGVWIDNNGNQASSLISALADTKVTEISSKMDTLTMAEIMGLKEIDGVWYNSDGVTKASGIMSAIANSTISSVSSDIDEVQIGKIVGYTKPADDNPEGKWYNGDQPATGIIAELSDLKIKELGDEGEVSKKIRNVTLAVALGYTYRNDDLSTQDKDESGWYNGSEKITGIMAKLADKPINDMNSAIDALTLDDVFTGEKTGLLAVIPAGTPINDINGAINESLQNTPLQFFINEGLIAFDDNSQNMLDNLCYQSEDKNGQKDKMIDISSLKIEKPEKYAYYANCKGYHTIKDRWGEEHTYVWGEDMIPEWRTVPLNQSLNYIVNLIPSI